jgi:hypothetical protein
MLNTRSRLWLYLLAVAGLSACTKNEESSTGVRIDPVELEIAKSCYAASNEQRLKFFTSRRADSLLSAEAILAERRFDERVCLAEAVCLKIDQAQRGMYLMTCLKREPDDT